MAKRNANTELNHDNWNDEQEPEEAGVFAKADNDTIKGRIIKKAKRRGITTVRNFRIIKSRQNTTGLILENAIKKVESAFGEPLTKKDCPTKNEKNESKCL